MHEIIIWLQLRLQWQQQQHHHHQWYPLPIYGNGSGNYELLTPSLCTIYYASLLHLAPLTFNFAFLAILYLILSLYWHCYIIQCIYILIPLLNIRVDCFLWGPIDLPVGEGSFNIGHMTTVQLDINSTNLNLNWLDQALSNIIEHAWGAISTD